MRLSTDLDPDRSVALRMLYTTRRVAIYIGITCPKRRLDPILTPQRALKGEAAKVVRQR